MARDRPPQMAPDPASVSAITAPSARSPLAVAGGTSGVIYDQYRKGEGQSGAACRRIAIPRFWVSE